MNAAAMTFAVVLPALLVAHNVADHWMQTNHQAATKGQRGPAGRAACAAHVGSYTAVTALVVGLLWLVFGLDVSPLGFVAGQLVSAVTHYWADRRFTLARLAALAGLTSFYALGQPRGFYVQVDGRIERRDLPGGGHTLSVASEDVPIDQPTLGTGAYAMDQSWHWLWLFVAALLTAVL